MRPDPFQALPDSVEVCGRIVPIDADFGVGIAIELEAAEPEPDVEGLLLKFYRGAVPEPVEEAAEQMIQFYAHQDGGEEKSGGKSARMAYDFAQDADAILASFLEAYRIDLSAVKLHWWTFKRLLCNLPPETPFMKRMYYRTADTKDLSKSERKHVEKMRRLYALKKTVGQERTAEELDAAYKNEVWRRYAHAKAVIEDGSRL